VVVACFILGRAKDLSAPLSYVQSESEASLTLWNGHAVAYTAVTLSVVQSHTRGITWYHCCLGQSRSCAELV